MNDSDLRERAERVLGYTFVNPDLLTESRTPASIADNRLKSNERLELLGEAVLDLVICEAL
ncbi:MAG: ribonuclease III, partial [Anaerolineae bacterium]|nr:ribonuclease III [Phycisphaerae bacterium]